MLEKLEKPADMVLTGIAGGTSGYVIWRGLCKKNPITIMNGTILLILSGIAAFIAGYNSTID